MKTNDHPWRRLARALAPAPGLSRLERHVGLVWVVRNGVASQAMETLTIGAFLVAYALQLGASNFQIGLLAAIPHLVQVLQLAGIYMVERLRNRRLICVLAGGLSRPMLLVIAAAAFLPSSTTALAVLIAAFFVRYSLGAIVSTGWSSWTRDLIPEGRRGRFFANRLVLMTFVGMGISLAAAGFIDLWRNYLPLAPIYAYSVLFVGAFLFGVASVYCMARIPEPEMPVRAEKVDYRSLLRQPFTDQNFRRLIIFLGSWNFAVNLAAPFFAVYMLTRLQFDITSVTALLLTSQFANIVVLKQWGAIADRFSNKSVLAVCVPLFVACIFAWTFTTFPEKHAFTVPLLVAIHIFMGIATAGVTLASTTIGMKLAPVGEATPYLAASSIVFALSAGLAPIVGGLTADFFVARELSLALRWVSPSNNVTVTALSIKHWDFFFLLATAIGAYAVHRLALVREIGEVDERIVLNEFFLGTRNTVRNLSTVAGLRLLAEIPYAELKRATRRRARKAHRRKRAASDRPKGAGPT